MIFASRNWSLWTRANGVMDKHGVIKWCYVIKWRSVITWRDKVTLHDEVAWSRLSWRLGIPFIFSWQLRLFLSRLWTYYFRYSSTKLQGSSSFWRFFDWLVFYFAVNVGINIFLHVFMISCVCILLDLHFKSEMRSISVSNKKNTVQNLYMYRFCTLLELIKLLLGVTVSLRFTLKIL